jgi:histone-lysine N-methyltransferase SETD3
MKIPLADRGAYIEEFTTWMKENGAEISGVKIDQFPGYEYGIKAEKNFVQGDLLIAVPRKLMLTTENAGDSLLGGLL